MELSTKGEEREKREGKAFKLLKVEFILGDNGG